MTDNQPKTTEKSRRRRLTAISCIAAFVALVPVAALATTSPEPTGEDTVRESSGRGSLGQTQSVIDVQLPEPVAVPQVGAASWVVVDAGSGKTLAGNRAGNDAPMASTTKIMTVLVALKNAELDEELTVSENAAAYAIPEYSNAGLIAGDVLTVRETIKASLLVSGNDAAIALAEHVGGDVDGFVEMMNTEAENLGMQETNFVNPTGLDDDGHASSTRDLATLTRAAFEYEEFARDVVTEYDAVTTQDREIPLTNINELLYAYPAATGVKTGTSPGAGPSLVASAAAEDESYIVALLDDPDRYGTAIQLLDYGFVAFDRTRIVREEERYRSVDVPFRRDESIPLVAGEDISGLVGADSEVVADVQVPGELPESARRGDRIGSISVEIDGRPAGETALVADRGYEEAPVWQRLWYRTSSLWQ